MKCVYSSMSQEACYVKRIDIPAKDLPLAEKIKECQNKCGRTYGYRRVHLRLERENIHHNPKTILRVMQNYQQSEERNIVIAEITCIAI